MITGDPRSTLRWCISCCVMSEGLLFHRFESREEIPGEQYTREGGGSDKQEPSSPYRHVEAKHIIEPHYKRKLEAKLQQNTRDIWAGMREITGFNMKDRQPVSNPDRANELNCFFNRSSSQSSAVSPTSSGLQTPSPPRF